MSKLGWAAAAALLTMACNGGGEDTETEVPTYHADVRPVLDQYCVRCHQEGGLGVGDWTNQEHVELFGDLIADRMQSGDMPPPVSDPACRDYVGSDYLSVPQSASDTISAWVAGGMPVGDPADDPQVPVEEVDLVDADLTIMMEEPYTPVFDDAANPGNEYRCFLVDPGEDEIHISGMDPIIGADELVHHVVLFGLDRDEVEEGMNSPGGWDCIDDMDADAMIAGWAPGTMPLEFPDGYTMTTGGDQVLVLQMHYFQADPESAGTSDLSGYAFHTAPEPGRPVIMAPLGSYNWTIPAGDDDFKHSTTYPHSLLGVNIDIQVHAIFPHMHRLGTHYSMKIEHEDGTSTCLVEGDYDFDNQLTYQFRERPLFSPGDRITFECGWNNSDSNPNLVGDPIDTRYGERTDEEMCFFFTLVSPGAP